MNNLSRKKGFFFVTTGAICWGMGGTVAQKLFQEFEISVDWLVSVRLLIAGFLLLMISFMKSNRSQVFGVWKNRKSAFQLVVFGIVGMLAVQYTYMTSIKHGNAAVATLLQYLSPVMIIIYLLLRKQSIFTRQDVITVLLALGGCFFLLTNGSISQLSVPVSAAVWGVFSGVAAAFYTLYAVPLIKKYSSLVIVGWSMVIGGSVMSFIHPPWQLEMSSLSPITYVYVLFIIIFGTMFAFWFYVESLHSLLPKETSLLGSLEPLAAVFTTVVWLKEPFGFYQWMGTACIIGLVLLLTRTKQASSETSLSV
ncbi:DMT family transporter [Priestia aryabhattai]|uniref:DMT family transporter n=1 Tax=Priestia aryabhattai TaxID=412384 RepID=UPI00203F002D|nr:DMT family transporter [Priestia aryabhattai]MCM3770416.1 DMT family transporter [Priestia aryabhattai]